MATPGQRTPPPSPGRIKGDRIVRSAVLALLTYALGLIPFYLLTPVHDALPTVLHSNPGSVPTAIASPRPARGGANVSTPLPRPNASATPSGLDLQKKIGADVAPVSAPTDSTSVTAVASPTAPTMDSRYAFVLLGYGGGGHDGAYLSDSVIIVIVDPDHRALTMLSVPRDSWVPLQFDGRSSVYEKINTAYAFAKDPTLYPDRLDKYTGSAGAGTFAADTVSRLLGVPVRYYLGIDFQGFRQMINAVGGIDVVVPDSFSAQYPANDDPSIDASWMTVRFRPGPEHMTGERAIEFARAREVLDNPDEGSDFARSRRQRLIMESFKTRLFQAGGLIHLPQLVSIAATHVDTNYSIPDVAQLSQLALDWKSVKIYQTAITTNNFLEEGTGPDGTYLLVPRSPDHSWAQIEAFTQRLWTDPEVGVAMASTSVLVENDSGVPGAATRLTSDLLKLGYHVLDPTSGPVQAQTHLVDRTAGGSSPLAHQLSADLGKSLDLTTMAPDPGADDEVILQLGSDDADLTLATTVPDLTAPFSVVGVTHFGEWVPDTASADVPTATPERPRGERTPPHGTASATPTSIFAYLTPHPSASVPLSPGPTTGTPVPADTPAPGSVVGIPSSPAATPPGDGGTPANGPGPSPSPTGALTASPTGSGPAPTASIVLPTSTRAPPPVVPSPTPRPKPSPTLKH